MSGQPCIDGTRVLAADIALHWATEETLREMYPTLPPGAVAAVQHWVEVCGLVERYHHVKPDAVISYTYGEIDDHGDYAGFVVLFERADGSTGIAPFLGIAREWRTRDPLHEFDRLTAEGELLREEWIERNRLADLELSEEDYAVAWEAWKESRPARHFDLYWDSGYLEPIAMKLKHRFSNRIALAMEDHGLDDNAAAKMSKVHVHDIEQMRRGIVRHFAVYDLMWVLSRIGQRVFIDAIDDEDGGISFDGP